jgi:hypothetical protein
VKTHITKQSEVVVAPPNLAWERQFTVAGTFVANVHGEIVIARMNDIEVSTVIAERLVTTFTRLPGAIYAVRSSRFRW